MLRQLRKFMIRLLADKIIKVKHFYFRLCLNDSVTSTRVNDVIWLFVVFFWNHVLILICKELKKQTKKHPKPAACLQDLIYNILIYSTWYRTKQTQNDRP